MRALARKLSLLGITGLALAAGVPAVGIAADAPAVQEGGVPPLHHVNGITYVSGGIGSDEAAALRRIAPRFNVRMHFLDSGGDGSLSDVSVTLFNARREIVLLVLSEGPYLFFKLEPGTYRAVVRYGVTIESHGIEVKPGGRALDLQLRFPARNEPAELLAAPPQAGAPCQRAAAPCGRR
ncbi:hypothetical protein BKK79_24815 [Cupriavidus sp. USMAA2-4]|uniref:hypothetical protein n=1 Tax=Cupriavidus sp. USMAA2-4 TaxID=876364 RepID=UPI0008A68B12|nr:hypothetical protein [Cupriavidus sp. USMAA2-4]AOY95046.1 hypothetical protein BKK79_24815 [Cupriavidus sp. USMAA2-4]